MVNMDVFTLHNTALNILTFKKINSRAVEQDLSGLNSSHELQQTAHCNTFPDTMKNGNKSCRYPYPSVQLLKYNRKIIFPVRPLLILLQRHEY